MLPHDFSVEFIMGCVITQSGYVRFWELLSDGYANTQTPLTQGSKGFLTK